MKGFRRPKMVVLPERALPPEGNLVERPARLSHVLAHRQPYFYSLTTTESDGSFDSGTRVALLSRDGPWCRVVDEQGLSVFTPCDGLQPSDGSGSKAKRPARVAAGAGRSKRKP
jgi:hypothetical protein